MKESYLIKSQSVSNHSLRQLAGCCVKAKVGRKSSEAARGIEKRRSLSQLRPQNFVSARGQYNQLLRLNQLFEFFPGQVG